MRFISKAPERIVAGQIIIVHTPFTVNFKIFKSRTGLQRDRIRLVIRLKNEVALFP